MIKKAKQNNKIKPIGEGESLRILEIKEDRTLPADMICRYCGKDGPIWDLGNGLFKCGHCLRIYSCF